MSAPVARRTPFSSVLIANRGEIALRVIRSARAAGLRTVAVYSDADAGARYVRAADMAVRIGEPQPARSYLDIGRIIEAARETGSEAIHPGYGFLSENAAFARACAEARLVFIGPGADAIERMGDKAGAKAAMLAAGVPCVPGYQGDSQDEATLAAEAERIGWPLMIKAVAGGGGRGMRLVADAAGFAAALQSAKSEARGAFGDDRVLLEKAIVRPRHIEIQVMADRHGNAIHLGERDCSVQRRHQKLIEEAPSPFVSAELRARMGEAAVAAVLAIGYEGAGTLEFLVDADGAFYFMEMNTRLQVEHPVTEAITGLDLVALQLRVAAGEPLGLTQDDIHFDGHAIEVRLCAEDPRQGFTPQSGEVALWRMPANVRVEDALETGATVPPFYDSMVAKLISHAPTRDAARRKLVEALDATIALGLPTNRAFLRDALRHETFAAGGATTAFVGDHGDAIAAADGDDHAKACAIAAALLRLTQGTRPALPNPLATSFATPMRFDLDGATVDCRLAFQRHGIAVSAAEGDTLIAVDAIAANDASFRLGAVTERAAYARRGDTLFLQWRGSEYVVRDLTHTAVASTEGAVGDGLLKASMTGQVVQVHAGVGDEIAAGQPLVTLEAMKMEHAQALRGGGRVVEVFVRTGDQVNLNEPLMRIAV
ncbi:MAG: acetyl-CoA carboxylase biotin carboxylase subunit [Rhizobiaceae bacterium]